LLGCRQSLCTGSSGRTFQPLEIRCIRPIRRPASYFAHRYRHQAPFSTDHPSITELPIYHQMSTFGEIRHLVTVAFKDFAGRDPNPDLVDAYITQRYEQILDRLSWSRQSIISTLTVTAPYTTGTVAVSQGGTAVTLTGGTWTSTMNGRAIRISHRNEYYEFTFVSASGGTLDRPYEGASETAAGYSIYQNVYALPADCRMIDGLHSYGMGPLDRKSLSELRALTWSGNVTGTPRYWSSYMDDTSDPPRMQVMIYPYPDRVAALEIAYTAEVATFSGTSSSLRPWIRTGPLMAGALSDLCLPKFIAEHREYEALYERKLGEMIQEDARRSGPGRVQIADRYSDHRIGRWERWVFRERSPL
jgi:hypothetical protein